MNVGSTNAASSAFVETVDEDEESDDEASDDDQDDDWEFDFENTDDLNDCQEQLDAFMASAVTASKAKGMDPAHFPRSGKSVLMMQNAQSTSQPKTLYAQDLHCLTTVAPMTACCNTSMSMLISSWMHSLPPRRVANHHEVILVASSL